MSELADIEQLIVAKGEEIKILKANKADKETIAPHVAELLALKERYQIANNGVPYGPPPAEKEKKKPKGPVEEAPAREGPSKKELNKLKKKEKKAAYADGSVDANAPPIPAPTAPVPIPVAASAPVAALPVAPASGTGGITYHAQSAPILSRIVMVLLGVDLPMTESPATSPPHQAYLHSPSANGGLGGSISGDYAIARFLCRSHGPHLLHPAAPSDASALSWCASEVDQWIDHCIAAEVCGADSSVTVNLLNSHLTLRTYLAGSTLSLADIAVHNLIVKRGATFPPHVQRWVALVTSLLPSPGAIYQKKGGDKAKKEKGSKPAKADGAAKGGAKNDEPEDSCPELEGAVEGQVCTRFPPEPSGYLHIGHTKAALLNQYYANRYKGRLIIRFDDTNPSKEKGEYAENILRDLATLNIKGDVITHTSDSFDICEQYAYTMIRQGLAYMDDTDQEKMQAERMARKESYRRNTPPAENEELFRKLLAGDPNTTKFCLRAKIDMSSVNGTMRDPVLYRFNDTPHHRTGTKYKAYPTYDFACPIVDSIEGVTHALRTTEYNDRDEQYHWLQEKMGLRRVHILAYGKINFVNSVLSKRKLTWFVDNGHVDGWTDPRFPTIQGCVRRGMQVEALKNFIISQGASRRVINMEWDKFWSDNKKILEDISPRYMAVSADFKVTLTVTNIPDTVECVSIPVHPSKPEMGSRVLRRLNKIYLETEDCQPFVEGEEVTLVRWGNFFMDKIERNSDGVVVALEGRFNPEAKNFSKTKKVTWVAAVPDLVPCQLCEFDHLISKKKLEDSDDFKDFITPVSKAERPALADPCLRTVQAGDVIQLERKGFFRCDKPYGGSPDKPAVLFLIPDGKVKAMSTLSSALGHR